jgi:hypothetical protein
MAHTEVISRANGGYLSVVIAKNILVKHWLL